MMIPKMAIGLALVAFLASRGSGGSDSANGENTDRSTSQEPSSKCNFADVKPTYLPWLSGNVDVPPPEEFHGPDEAAWLYWKNPGWDDQDSSPYYVSLRRDDDPVMGDGAEIDATVPGAGKGELFKDAFGSSPVIVWALQSEDECQWISLELVAPDMSSQEANQEIVRIADSLQ